MKRGLRLYSAGEKGVSLLGGSARRKRARGLLAAPERERETSARVCHERVKGGSEEIVHSGYLVHEC